jgi:Zn-dependent oligopeptidase
LKTKKAAEVALAFKDIYKKGPLTYPKQFHSDNGAEFKSSVDTLLKEHDVEVKRVTTKYHHRFTAFVERFNRTMAERLFKVQDAQELQDSTKDSKTWVKHLQTIVRAMNNEKTEMTGIKLLKRSN